MASRQHWNMRLAMVLLGEELRMNRLLFVLCAAGSLAMAGVPEPIHVDGGQVTGTPTIQWTPGVRLFRGIPYAAPPVGNLRWRPPQPVVPWQGVRAADHFSAACMQPPTETDGSSAWHEGLIPISEDCLYLNIWTPARSASEKLPVMVFIHGGGNVRGAGSENQYDGAYLAKKGVVFVNFNYRMSVFGFLAYPELTAESEHHSSGNYAILDQIAALQWIQQNIAKFGGDSNRVMIFGHSAGASNVCSLMASPLAKGLFHRALAQSGNNLSNRTSLADAERKGVKLGEAVGAASIAALRKKSAEEILDKLPRGMLGTNIDGWVFPQDVYSIFAAGKQNDVPLIVGTVADDVPGFGTVMKAANAQASAQNTFHELADKYLKLYPASTDAEATKSAFDFRTNSAMANARTWLRLQTQTGKSKAYWYYFTHVSPMPEGLMWAGRPALAAGAYHGGEIVYVFNAFPLQDWKWRQVDLELGDMVSSIWTNFVNTGSPNGAALPEWPAFDPNANILMLISDTAVAEPAPYQEKLDFIDEWMASQRGRR
jgi:para-nitrobenzyl esterase